MPSRSRIITSKIIAGWEEWCALPELGLPAVKMKVDTGADTSSLHAFHIKLFRRGGRRFVRFHIHPLPGDLGISRVCEAPLVDKRHIKSSSGQKERRPVISTAIELAGRLWNIQVTLANRDAMGYRMLLGREAMQGRVLVDPDLSCCQRRLSMHAARLLYLDHGPERDINSP